MPKLLHMILFLALLGRPGWAETPRHIVLFVSDDHGVEVGCYGDPVARTPHMDQLAREGVRFTNAFATTASCSASRSVLLTGLYNHANGQYGHTHHFHHFRTYDWITSLPVLLNRAGYRTARAGKYHVAPEEIYQFDQVVAGGSRDVVTMVNNARSFLEADRDQPFFLYICTSDPHRGGGIAKELEQAPDRFGNRPPGSKPYPGIDPVLHKPGEMPVPGFLPDTPATRAELAQYYQAVSRIDQGFGHLLETLKELDLYDQTLIIYTSDHGMAMAGAKTTVYEPGLRVPLIVRHPDLNEGERGRTSDALVNLADITPTLLDYAGVLDPASNAVPERLATRPEDIHRPGSPRVPLSFHGRSFLGAMEGEELPGWDSTYASHTFHEIQMYYPMRVVRERQWKLIWNIAYRQPFPFASDLWASATWQHQYAKGMEAPYGARTVGDYIHRPEFELYDLAHNPGEAKNLANHPEHAALLERLKTELRAFQERTEDPWILKWEYE